MRFMIRRVGILSIIVEVRRVSTVNIELSNLAIPATRKILRKEMGRHICKVWHDLQSEL